MRKIFKWLSIVLGGLLLLLLLGSYVSGSIRVNKSYAVQADAIAIRTNLPSIERGRQWVKSGVCIYCHGGDLSGTDFINDPMIGRIPAPNLTSGAGGAGSEFTDDDWVRTIRFGIAPEGRGLIVMPSSQFYYLSDRDLGDIIAYFKSIPPIDREWPAPEFSISGKIFLGSGVMGNFIEAENIDFNAARPPAPEEGVTAAYGDYLTRVSGCRICHGEDLRGVQKPPNPAAPPVPGLVAGSEISFWSEPDFIQTIRTGVAPSGHPLTEFMPWKEFRHMTDDQLRAIRLYLVSLSGN